MPNKFKSSDGKIMHCPHCRGVIFKTVDFALPQPENRILFNCKHCGQGILVFIQGNDVLIRKGLSNAEM